MSRARPNDKFGRRWSQHCIHFSTFWREVMKILEALHLSIVWPFAYFKEKRWKMQKHQISALFTLLLFLGIKTLLSLIQFPKENQDPGRFPCAARRQIWGRSISALYMLLDILLRSDEKFGSSRSQHCICFSNYWRQLRGQQISRPYTDLLFFIKKTCKKKHLKSWKCIQIRMLGAATGGSLRGQNLRFVYGLYFFFMRSGRWHPRLPARRVFVCRTGRHSCEGSDGVRRP